MKKMQRASQIVCILGVALLALNGLITPLPDWVVRTVGVTLILAIFTLTFSTVRLRK